MGWETMDRGLGNDRLRTGDNESRAGDDGSRMGDNGSCAGVDGLQVERIHLRPRAPVCARYPFLSVYCGS